MAIGVGTSCRARRPERLSRFQREAEALASLNHSNIGVIYDVQEVEGFRFLVLELVEGETLAERIDRGPIGIDEALDIARQTAEALEAAHEKGVIHRDLKPANLKITPEGRVKVLDFGLAKIHDASVPASLSNSPTLLSGSLDGSAGQSLLHFKQPRRYRIGSRTRTPRPRAEKNGRQRVT